MKLRSHERLFGLDEEIDRRLPRVRSLRLIIAKNNKTSESPVVSKSFIKIHDTTKLPILMCKDVYKYCHFK